MKIAVNKIVESHNAGLDVSGMGLDTNKTAKLFTILSDGLYKNKLMSIIREVMSNCYDSHVMAGLPDNVIQITAPTLEHPFLIFRDNGIGLTPEEAEKTIFMFLGSAKDDSDDYIGGWGLGSKSPFAYTDTFETILYKDGKRWEYNCWKDEEGMPQKAMFSEDSTVEPNGVEVRIPILERDVYSCNQSLRHYLYRTRFNYCIVNEEYFSVSQSKTVWTRDVQGTQVSIVEHDKSRVFIYYGGFTYDLEDIQWKEEDAARINLWKTCLRDNQAIYLHANIGDASFSVSRESIAGTEKTYSWVLKTLKQLADYIDEGAKSHAEMYLKPLFDRFMDDKGKPLNNIKLLDVANAQSIVSDQKAEHSSEIFYHFSFYKWARTLSHNDGAFFTSARSSNSDLFRVMITANLNDADYPVQYQGQKKPSNAMKFFRHLEFKQNGSRSRKRSSRDYHIKVGHVNKIDVSLNEMLAIQTTLLWTDKNLTTKDYADFKHEHVGALPSMVFVIRAPDQATAEAIALHVGFAGLPVTPFEDNQLNIDTAEREKRAKNGKAVGLPTFMQCMDNATRHEYYLHKQFYYFDPAWKVTRSEFIRSGASFRVDKHGTIFTPSSTWLKKYAGQLDNVTAINGDNWDQIYTLDKKLRDYAAAKSMPSAKFDVLYEARNLADDLRDRMHPALLQHVGMNPVKLAKTHKIYTDGLHAADNSDFAGLKWAAANLGVNLDTYVGKAVGAFYTIDELKAARNLLNRSEYVRAINWNTLKKLSREVRLTLMNETLKELDNLKTLSATIGAV